MARLRVEVIEALPGGHASVSLRLEEGSTVRAALVAAGRPPTKDVGIHGRRVSPETRLADGDRVEIYRALRVDPKEARRRRARGRRR